MFVIVHIFNHFENDSVHEKQEQTKIYVQSSKKVVSNYWCVVTRTPSFKPHEV